MSECYCYELPEPHECNYCVEQKTHDLQQEVIAQLRKKVERLSKTDYEEDSVCKEHDGCPTEKAVLQREWRRLHAEVAQLRKQNEALIKAVERSLDHYGRTL